MFLSDIVTADGKFLEQHVYKRSSYLKRSKYDFPREEPADEDWENWMYFWKSHLLSNYELPTPLGAWKCETHPEWEWRHDSVTNTLYRRHQKNFQTYKPDKCKPYNFNENEWVENLPETVPVSVKVLRSGVARISSRCKDIVEVECCPKSFWEVFFHFKEIQSLKCVKMF